MSDRDCAAPRHGDEPEPAEYPSYLCKVCKLNLKRDLHRLPQLARELEQLLNPQQSSGGGHGNGDGLPYHEPASECRSQMRHDLVFWVTAIADERGFDPPVTMTADDTGLIELAAMAGWITGQIRWATFRPWCGDMAAAFSADRSQAMAIIEPRPRADIPIPAELNYCPPDHGGCGQSGKLAAVIYQAEGDKRESMVACSGCDHEWPAKEWLRLGKTLITWREQKRAA